MHELLNDATLLLAEYNVLICLSGYLKYHGGSVEDKQKLIERRKKVANACNELAKNDEYIKEFITNRYHCAKLY